MSTSNNAKVYVAVLEEIRKHIQHKELQAGDKLPSERALADKLHAARSSVREALRALELLGLIETRRGEGTYLRDYRPYQAVELLSSFILQDINTRKDIIITKKLIEKEVLKQLTIQEDFRKTKELDAYMDDSSKLSETLHHNFFYYAFRDNGNDLLGKIWQLLEAFSSPRKSNGFNPGVYGEIWEEIKKGEVAKVEELFEELYS